MLQLWLRSQNEYILQRKGHVQCEDVQARKGCTFSPCLQVSRFFRERDTKLDGTKDLDMVFRFKIFARIFEVFHSRALSSFDCAFRRLLFLKSKLNM